MADLTMKKDGAYNAPTKEEPITMLNGTDTVEIHFIDDYSKMGLKVTASGGAVAYYEVAITAR